jgi:bifunctional non-homologous end joining protein LigD
VIRAEIGGWTRDGHVRQTSFKGFELERDPLLVVKEEAMDPSAAEAQAEHSGAVAQAAAPSGPPSTSSGQEGVRPMATRAKRAPRKPEHPWEATADELKALDELGREGLWEVGGETLKLTNLDKVLFEPRDGIAEDPVTKRDLIRYFARIAPAMLPHLQERALNLHRYPNGAGKPGFWQKNMPDATPKWLSIWHETGVQEREDREANDHILADRAATLCYLANLAAFEIHAWTSRIDDPWRPTYALIDIDPGEKTTWDETITIAKLYRTALEHLGVRAYPKTTGSRGIQAFIPITPGKYEYSDTSDWVEKLSRAVGATVPELVSWEWAKKSRGGKMRLDYTQNASIKTLVAPYAVRPRNGAPVSMPIDWSELDDAALRSDRWTIRDAVERVEATGDAWAALPEDTEQDLPPL